MDIMCQSCLMPFHKDPGARESEQYCSLCFKNGELQYIGNDLKEFQMVCYESMRKRCINPLLAKLYTFMIRFAPKWKKN